MKKVIRAIVIILCVWWGFSVLIAFFKVNLQNGELCEDEMTEYSEYTDHQRNWQFISTSERHCMSFQTQSQANAASKDHRFEVYSRLAQPSDPWKQLYREFSDRDEDVEFLVDSMRTIAINEGLSGIDLAELVVTFVQDIPYSFVITGDCDDWDKDGHPCVGNVRLGLYTPYEFLHTEMGDCDTRAVLIFAVLERLGFEPVIVISDEYAHAMIALNIPTSGDFITHKGKKYYFWETTAKGWMAGMLPPSYGNKDYWKIALANEL